MVWGNWATLAGGNFLQLVLLCIDGTLDLTVRQKNDGFS